MAESLAAQEAKRHSEQASGGGPVTIVKNKELRRLKLIAFGDTGLSFLNVPVINLDRAIEMVKRSGGRHYTIKTNGRGMLEIEYEPDDAFTVAIYNQSRWVTNICVEAKALNIGEIVRAESAQVTTRQATKCEPRNVHATFKLENRGAMLLKRLDVQGHNTAWFSVFSHHNNMLMARPNGNWVDEKMQYFMDQLTTQTINNYRRSNGQEVLPANGTAVALRRQSAARAAAQDDVTVTTTAGAQTVLTLPDNVDAQAIQLLQNEQIYKQRKEALKRQFEELREEQAQYEQEVAEFNKIKDKVARVNEEYAHYQAKRTQLVEEIVEVGKAKEELAARKGELQEEKILVEKEQEDLTARKNRLQEEEDQLAQDMNAIEARNEQPLWHLPGTDLKLTDRFTNRFRVVANWVDGRIMVRTKATADDQTGSV